MTLEDKKFIKEAIDTLLNNINSQEDKLTKLVNFTIEKKSLFVWCEYQMFVDEILYKYGLDKEGNNAKKLEEIVNFLELDEFDVSAKNDLKSETEKVKKYIKKINDKLNK